MALVKMKHLSLLALRQDRDRLLRAMQRLGSVQVSDGGADGQALSETEALEARELSGRIERLDAALALLGRYDRDPAPLFGMLPEAGGDEAAEALGRQEEIFSDLLPRLERDEARLQELRGIQARARAALEALRPWEGLDISPGEGRKLASVTGIAGRLPSRSLEAAQTALAALAVPGGVETISQSGGVAYVFVLFHNSCAGEAQAALEEAGFEEERFPGLAEKTPALGIRALQEELESVSQERARLERAREEAALSLRRLKVLRDALQLGLLRTGAAERCAATRSTFLLEGWVPESQTERVAEALARVSPSCAVEFRDPAAGEEPPVQLKNRRLPEPFETVVEGYSLPSYRGIDPTPVMAPFFACLFGMMVSDAGYGLVMTAALLIFMKVKKIPRRNSRTLRLLTIGGVLTVVWGFVYNSFFGFSPLPERLWLLDSVRDPLLVMGVCIGFGALHLFAGLLTGAWMNLRRGDPVAAVSDQLSWMMLVVGLGLMALPSLAGAGRVLALGGVGIILLMAGRANKNPIKRLMGGLGALYGVSGWVGDLLSYIRLFGMGLATGVIAMVFNRLIGMVWDAGLVGKLIGAVLFVACHGFNLAINVLGAYVHACRLQYIEFFGKFYEEGGKAFRPLAADTRYVRIPVSGGAS